jgi:hypothetical protein
MIPFFKDERYIRIDGKPLLKVFGAPDDFVLAQEVWRREGINAGLPEPFLMHKAIPEHGERYYEEVKVREGWDAAYEFPPRGQVSTFTNDHVADGFGVMGYKDAMAVSSLRRTDKRLFRTAFPSWDNSPRKGSNNSYIYHNSSPELFAYWLDTLTRSTPEDIVFINAWNEWGEGATLEPSTAVGYANLEALTAPASSVDLGGAFDEIRGVVCHWRGDEAYHAGEIDDAKLLWADGARLGNERCKINLGVL